MGKLGIPISFVSALGRDDLARQMLELLESEQPVICPLQPSADQIIQPIHSPQRTCLCSMVAHPLH